MERHHVAGIHAVRSALRHGAEAISAVWYDAARKDRRLRQLLDEAKRLGLRPVAVDKAELERLTEVRNHQGVVAEARVPDSLDEVGLDGILSNLDEVPLLLVLDGVEDPHNLGACLRTADAVGVHAVIAPRDRAVGLTPVVCKVASGAAEKVPFVQVTNLARTLAHLQNEHRVWVIGTAVEGARSLYETDLTGGVALVMGAEGEGMRRLTRQSCDELVHLPMRGSVQSLNVSVSAGVCLYEALRQRRS